MYIVYKILNSLVTILFIVLLSSLTVNAAEIRQYKELPNPADIEPAPRPGGDNIPRVTVRKSSQMRSPTARTRIPLIKEQIQRLGYEEVENGAMSFFSLDNVKARFIPIEDITKNISSPLSIISNKGGIYKTMTLAGAIAKGEESKTGRWTHVSRYYSLENGSILILSESDYKAAQYSTTFPEELINVNINGAPASLITKKTTAGKYFTKLSWFTENKIYSLHLSSRAVGVGIKNELVALAIGIQQP